MNPSAANEGRSSMTGVAIQAGLQVRRVGLSIFTNRRSAIVAGITPLIAYSGMVKRRSSEGIGVMTCTTIRSGLDMIGWFAGG